jgi:hypothetical protein
MTNLFLSEVELRSRAETRIKDRRGYYAHLLLFIAVNVVMWIIYAVSGSDSGEPIFSTLGWGAGLIAHSAEYYANSGKRLEERERSVREALIEDLGREWQHIVTFDEYKTVRKTVEKRFKQRFAFFPLVVIYLVVVIMLWLMWGMSDGDFPWPLFPSMIWGFFVLWNGLETFAKLSWVSREHQYEREMEHERELLLGETQKAKREPYLLQTAANDMLEVIDAEDDSRLQMNIGR